MNLLRPPCDDEAILSRKPATTKCGRAQRRWILAATILGSSMVFIDGTVVNVALPALQSALHATLADVQWVGANGKESELDALGPGARMPIQRDRSGLSLHPRRCFGT